MSKFNPHDKYFRKAKEEGYRARSAFKLSGIQDKFNLIKPGMNVLDLGSAPGSFLQYISSEVGKNGVVIGIDLQEIEPFKEENIWTYVGDIYDEDHIQSILKDTRVRNFDVVTSDIAPKTTGIPSLDGNASLDLNLQVLEVSKMRLRKGGSLVMKILGGFNEGDLIGAARKLFKEVRKYRPEAIRKSSHESYIICLKKI